MFGTKLLLALALLSLAISPVQAETGRAAFYNGGRTASGERTGPNGLTAAHRTLPFGTRVRVTNHRNGKVVVVRIADRGPWGRGHIIDLSRAAARQLDMISAGTAMVSIERQIAAGWPARLAEAFASASSPNPCEHHEHGLNAVLNFNTINRKEKRISSGFKTVAVSRYQ